MVDGSVECCSVANADLEDTSSKRSARKIAYAIPLLPLNPRRRDSTRQNCRLNVILKEAEKHRTAF
jgi:hypothetical protein